MSILPGISVATEADGIKNELALPALSEWRFEVPLNSQLKVVLKSGTAEIFGTELAQAVEYSFVNQKSAVFTYHGCTLEWSVLGGGEQVSEYTSDETPMNVYANLHFALEARRIDEARRGREGRAPVVLVLGPANAGKTSLCKILSAYANKMGRYPMMVNLNPGEGMYTVPGGLSAAPISDILDVENGWGSGPINGPTVLHTKQPLVYWYGLEDHTKAQHYYSKIINVLSIGVAARLDEDERVRQSGVIIDTPANLDKDTIQNIVADFEVNVIVVIGQERLYSDLNKRFKAKVDEKTMTIVKVPRSGGCVERTDEFMRALRLKSIREYFYGTQKQPLSPFNITVNPTGMQVYRVNDDDLATDMAFAADGDEKKDSAASVFVKMEASSVLQNFVMAVLNADPNEPPENLVRSEVIGFVHVFEADDTKKKMKILMPVQERLPQRPFVIGDARYYE